MPRLPNPGDKKKDFFTREFYKKALERDIPPLGVKTNLVTTNSSTHILGQIPEEGTNDIEPYELVSCHGVHIPVNADGSHLMRPVMKIRSYKDAIKSRFWGVSTDFIDKTRAGKIQISGIAWVKTQAPITAEEAYTHLDIVGQDTQFKLGGFPIIGVPTTPHSLIALYREAPHYVGYTTTSIPARTGGTGGTAFTPGVYNALIFHRQLPLSPTYIPLLPVVPELRCNVYNLTKIVVPANSFFIAQYESGDLNIISIEDITCYERLEKFQMRSNWVNGIAIAKFWFMGQFVGSGGTVAVIRDELLIFSDQLSYGRWGLSIKTCDNKHHVIQAKCAQATVIPEDPIGTCEYGTTGSAQTSEADCTALGGTWTLP